MSTPIRIQRRRTKGFKLPPNTVCVTRGTKYGNPFRVNAGTRGEPMTLEQSLNLFESYCANKLAKDPKWLEPLRGKNLACFCGLSQPCHADILLTLVANLGDSANAGRVQASGNVEGKITTPLAKL